MTARPALRDRKRELRLRLAQCGVSRGPRRLGLAETDGAEHAARLREALRGFGPVLAGFGRYLSTRPDLLEIAECEILAGIPDRGPPAPAAAVLERLASELGVHPEEAFADLDETPCECRLFSQGHRGRLADGRRVVVRAILPGLEDDVERDLELLPLLKRALGLRDVPLDEVAADYRRHLARQLDLGRQAEALEALGREAVDSDLLVVPEVEAGLTGSRVLTVEWLDGTRLTERAAAGRRWEARSADLVRRLSLMWLQQALVARPFPVEAEVLETRDGRFAITGGVFASLPDASRSNLWSYLRHTTAHQPDLVCECLLRELRPRHRRHAASRLRLQLRQIVPFRDGCWTERGDTVAEHMILHWRVAHECGFRAPPHLLDFYRGLYWAARLGQEIDPAGDPLRAAQEDLRWMAGWLQFRRLTDPRQLGESLENNLANLLQLPQKLDDVLDLATREGTRLPRRAAEPASGRRGRASWAVVAALGLAMAALVLVSARLPDLGVSPAWAELIAAAAFSLLGTALLWAAGGPGGRKQETTRRRTDDERDT